VFPISVVVVEVPNVASTTRLLSHVHDEVGPALAIVKSFEQRKGEASDG
jgi:hypothetical protein